MRCTRPLRPPSRLTQRMGNRRAEIVAHHGCAIAYLERGEMELARPHAQAAVDVSRAIGARRFEPESMLLVAACLLLRRQTRRSGSDDARGARQGPRAHQLLRADDPRRAGTRDRRPRGAPALPGGRRADPGRRVAGAQPRVLLSRGDRHIARSAATGPLRCAMPTCWSASFARSRSPSSIASWHAPECSPPVGQGRREPACARSCTSW